MSVRGTIPETMLRIGKARGVGNIVVEEAPTPSLESNQVLVETRASLISRGSELGGRYLREEAIDPIRVGYAAAGEVVAMGSGVQNYSVGDRVYVVGPHAQFVVGDATKTDEGIYRCHPLGTRLAFEEGAFSGLLVAAIGWVNTADIQPRETVLVLGQGIVGSLMLQVARVQKGARLIAVDHLEMRCEMAARFGADHVINGAKEDVVDAVRRVTGGRGADVVIDAVGGKHGVESFRQAQAACRSGGRIMLVAMYQGEPMSVDVGVLMTRTLIGGNSRRPFPPATWEEAVRHLDSGVVKAQEMITHRFSFRNARQAFDLLYERPGDALGVVLEW